MKISFNIAFVDEDDRYFYSDVPPGYVYDVFAGMRKTSVERAQKDYLTYSSFKFEFQDNPESTIKDLLDEIIRKMELSSDSFYMCDSIVSIKMGTEIIGVSNYDILIDKVLSMFGNQEELEIMFVFSVLQGEIWRERKIRYSMYSHETGSHNKPHVHVDVENNKYSASVDIVSGEVLAGKLPPKYLKEIRKKICNNREYLISCWNSKTDGLHVNLNYGLQIVDFRDVRYKSIN